MNWNEILKTFFTFVLPENKCETSSFQHRQMTISSTSSITLQFELEMNRAVLCSKYPWAKYVYRFKFRKNLNSKKKRKGKRTSELHDNHMFYHCSFYSPIDIPLIFPQPYQNKKVHGNNIPTAFLLDVYISNHICNIHSHSINVEKKKVKE